MKKFISNHWNNILVVTGGIWMFIILISKFVIPKTLVADYIIYGKEIVPTDNEIINSATSNFRAVWGNADPELVRLTIIIMVAILLVVFITTLASTLGGQKDAKKKWIGVLNNVRNLRMQVVNIA